MAHALSPGQRSKASLITFLFYGWTEQPRPVKPKVEECVSRSTRNGVTPGVSPFCRVPAHLIWNISPLSATHFICPARFNRSLLLLFTFHHRQTLAWLFPNSTMSYINKHPDAASIIEGDFNKANLRQVMPNFHRHVSCPTRGSNTLDHCYTQFKNA